MHYRRARVKGGSYFFTLVTYKRQKILQTEANIKLLRDAFRYVIKRHAFTILYDLANISRPFVILTDDLARKRQPGFDLPGRASGSAPRGCSLALEDIH